MPKFRDNQEEMKKMDKLDPFAQANILGHMLYACFGQFTGTTKENQKLSRLQIFFIRRSLTRGLKRDDFGAD